MIRVFWRLMRLPGVMETTAREQRRLKTRRTAAPRQPALYEAA